MQFLKDGVQTVVFGPATYPMSNIAFLPGPAK